MYLSKTDTELSVRLSVVAKIYRCGPDSADIKSNFMVYLPPPFLSLTHPVFSTLHAPARPSILRRSFARSPRPSTPSLRFRSRGNLQELLEMDRPAGWKPRTRGIYANNWGNYVSVGPRVTVLFGLQSAGEIMLRTVVTSPLSSSDEKRASAFSVSRVRSLGANEIFDRLIAR